MMAPLSHSLAHRVLKKHIITLNVSTEIFISSKLHSDELINTCFNLLWRASEAAALIWRRRHYDAIVHATLDVLEYAWIGGAVTGNQVLVVSLSSHKVEGCFHHLLPFDQDCVAVAFCHCSDGFQSTRTCRRGHTPKHTASENTSNRK